MKLSMLALMISSVPMMSYSADKHILDDPLQIQQNKERRAIQEADTYMQRAKPIPAALIKQLNATNRNYAERYNQGLKVAKKFL